MMRRPLDSREDAGAHGLRWNILTLLVSAMTIWLCLANFGSPGWARQLSFTWTNPLTWVFPSAGNHLWGLAYVTILGAVLWKRFSRHSSPYISVAAVLAILTILLSFCAYLPHLGGTSILSLVSWLLAMFTGQVETAAIGPEAINHAAPFPLGFQIARVAGLTTTFLGALAVVLRLARLQIETRTVSRAGNVDVVVGTNPQAVSLVRALTEERELASEPDEWFDLTDEERAALATATRREIVVISNDPADPKRAELNQLGALVLSGDPTDKATLRRAMLACPELRPLDRVRRRAESMLQPPSSITARAPKTLRRVGQGVLARLHPKAPEIRDTCALNRLFAVTDSQRHNLSVLRGAEAILRELSVLRGAEAILREALHHGGDKNPSLDQWLAEESVPRLIARFDDPREARDWRLTQVAKPGYFVDAITSDELLARAIVRRATEHEASVVLILGDSPLGVALLDELATRVHFRRGLSTNLPDSPEPVQRVVVCDPQAEMIVTEWKQHCAPMGDALSLYASAETWEHATTESSKAAEHIAVVVTGEASTSLSARANRITRLHRDALVFAPSRNARGVEEPPAEIASVGVTQYGTTLLDGYGVPEDSWTVLARAQHDTYAALNGDPSDTRAARRPWGEPSDPAPDRLPPFFRDDNLRQLRLVLHKVRGMGFDWLPLQSRQGVPDPPITDDVVNKLARLEHSRWVQLRKVRGWRKPEPGDPTDNAARERLRINKYFFPWDELDVDDQTENVRDLKSIIRRLVSWGIAPTSRLRPFRRIGEVRAEQLSEPRSWVTDEGGTLWVQPGDWWIVGPDGTERGVATSEFGDLYEHVTANRFRRTGFVYAAPLTEPTVVHTLEGDVHSGEGFWLVTDDKWNQWPVPDGHFRKSYEAVPAHD